MLVRDPSERATAAEVLKHDWVKENGVAADVEIEPEVSSHASSLGSSSPKRCLVQDLAQLDKVSCAELGAVGEESCK